MERERAEPTQYFKGRLGDLVDKHRRDAALAWREGKFVKAEFYLRQLEAILQREHQGWWPTAEVGGARGARPTARAGVSEPDEPRAAAADAG